MRADSKRMPAVLNWDIMASIEPFFNKPDDPSGDGVILTHGAGGDCNGRLLVAVAGALSQAGFLVLASICRFAAPGKRRILREPDWTAQRCGKQPASCEG